MNRIAQVSAGLFVLSLSIATRQAAAADSSETGWRFKSTVAALSSTGNDGFSTTGGAGVSVEYRTSESFGVEFGAATGKVHDRVDFGFFGDFGDEVFSVDTSFRMTPVTARLNWHLTPGHRADLYLGPVAGWMHYGGLDVRVKVPGEGSTTIDHVDLKDGFAWGGHIGLDVPFGDSGFFFTSDATYLNATVKPTASSAAEGAGSFKLDPVIVQAGFGVRF